VACRKGPSPHAQHAGQALGNQVLRLCVLRLCVPFPGGGQRAWEAICGEAKGPLCELGWKSLGVLELTALPSIQRDSWVPTLHETDALLVWGGNVLYLSYWMQ
jgi:hypothetical protein